jgi:hypothetical protein
LLTSGCVNVLSLFLASFNSSIITDFQLIVVIASCIKPSVHANVAVVCIKFDVIPMDLISIVVIIPSQNVIVFVFVFVFVIVVIDIVIVFVIVMVVIVVVHVVHVVAVIAAAFDIHSAVTLTIFVILSDESVFVFVVQQFLYKHR